VEVRRNPSRISDERSSGMLSSILRTLGLARPKPPPSAACRRHRAVLRLETLECRLTPTVTITVTNLNNAGEGSLREAIAEGNVSSDDDIRINFQTGVTGTITLTSGFDDFDNNFTIQGSSVTLERDANSLRFRFFKVPADLTVSISGMTFADGDSDLNGGAIFNAGTLTLTGCAFYNNHADVDGGAVYNAGNLTASGCSAWANSARFGGAFHNAGGTLTLNSGCDIFSNTATHGGGGISNSGTCSISDSSLIEFNSTSSTGGGSTIAGR
jgi:hypothetical protein